MKKYVFLLYVILGFSTANVWAQDNQECLQNLSIFAENAKVKNYDAAYTPWQAVRSTCP